MNHFDRLIKLSFGLAGLSILLGIVFKVTGHIVFGLGPYSYFCFSALCLLYAVALSCAQIAIHMRALNRKEHT